MQEKLAKSEGDILMTATMNVKMNYFPGDARDDKIYNIEKRDYGSGPLRLGTVLSPNPDIYALLLAAQFKTELVDRHRWEAKMADDAIAQIVEKYEAANAKDMPEEIRPKQVESENQVETAINEDELV